MQNTKEGNGHPTKATKGEAQNTVAEFIKNIFRKKHGNDSNTNSCNTPTNNSVSTFSIDEQTANIATLENGKPNPSYFLQAALYLTAVIGADRQLNEKEYLTFTNMQIRITDLFLIAHKYAETHKSY